MIAARKMPTWSHPDLYTTREVSNTSLRHVTSKQLKILAALDEEEWKGAHELMDSTGLTYGQLWGGLQTLYYKDLVLKEERHGRAFWRKL